MKYKTRRKLVLVGTGVVGQACDLSTCPVEEKKIRSLCYKVEALPKKKQNRQM